MRFYFHVRITLKKKKRQPYFIVNRWESFGTKLVEILIHVLDREITANEGTLDESVRASKFFQGTSRFSLAQIVEESFYCQLLLYE